jgi:hypothetical protein
MTQNNDEFRKMLLDVIAAFEEAGKKVTDITISYEDREVKMKPEFLKQEPN